MDKLTDQQARVLAFVKACLRQNGAPPTRAEIAKHNKWKSPHAATCALQAIQAKGFVKLIPGIARGIRVL